MPCRERRYAFPTVGAPRRSDTIIIGQSIFALISKMIQEQMHIILIEISRYR